MAGRTRSPTAMLTLPDAGLVDVITVPLRPPLEQWLVEMWIELQPGICAGAPHQGVGRELAPRL